MNSNFTNDNSQYIDDGLDLGRIFRIILMQSKLVILLVSIFFLISSTIYFISPKNYKVTSLLHVFSNQSSSIGNNFDLNLMLDGATSDVSNLISLYKTRTNILEIIKSLNLHLEYKLEEGQTIEFDKFILLNDSSNQRKTFYIEFNGSSYSLYDENMQILFAQSVGELNEDSPYQINIKSHNFENNKILEVIYRNPNELFKQFKDSLIVTTSVKAGSFYRNEGLIEVSYITDNVDRGIKLINLANSIFLRKNIETESEKARKAIDFLDERISTVDKLLSENKLKLNEFKERNKSINVDLEIQSIIEKIAVIEQNINNVDIELAEANSIYTKTNPIYLNLFDKEALLGQKEIIENKIQNLPFEQQQYIDLYREVELSQELYAELINRKLSYSIMEASTLGNIRVVDDAYVDFSVSPKITIILTGMILGFIIGVIVAIIRGLYFIPISNPAELQDNDINIPVIGVTPKISEEIMDQVDSLDNVDLSNKDNDFERLMQSIESTVINIKALNSQDIKCPVISISSPTPANGKSFLSRTIAKKIASVGDKVLLVDNDQKRGVLHKFFNTKKISSNEFFNIDESNIDKYKISDNLYVIPKIESLSNSFGFIYDERYSEKIKFFQEKFDYIIFDTAPLLSVSDTSMLIGLSNYNISVIRHSLTKINEVKQLVQVGLQIGREVDGVIYNAYERPSSYYGYYGLYGNYAYQYYANKYLYESYEYNEKK